MAKILGEAFVAVPAEEKTFVSKVLPYLKTVVVVIGIVAGVVVHVVAGPPAWVLLIVAVATALGVYTIPNKNLVTQLSTDVKAVEPVLKLVPPVTDPTPTVEAPVLPSQLPTPPQPVKPDFDDPNDPNVGSKHLPVDPPQPVKPVDPPTPPAAPPAA